MTKEFLYSWFDGFKNFDVNKLKNQKMLIDTFVNSVVLYDDRIDFYFNFKDNAKSLTLSELNTVSDLSSSSPPTKNNPKLVIIGNSFGFSVYAETRQGNPLPCFYSLLFGFLLLPTFHIHMCFRSQALLVAVNIFNYLFSSEQAIPLQRKEPPML